MPDTIIKGLTELFRVPLSIDVDANIYKILNERYQTNLVPILKKATKAQLNPWAAIAAAAKKQANLLIKQLAANNASTKQLLQAMRFQRALLGREPYFVTTDEDSDCDSLILLNDSLVTFLKKTAKKSQKIPTSLNDALVVEPLTPDDLHHYWIPYSTLFENLKKEDDQTLSIVDILEILTGVITEESHRFKEIFIENDRFKEHLNALKTSEIVSLFAHKKLTDAHFETIFGYLATLENGKKLSQKNRVAICATQPSALKYFCQNDEKNSQSLLIKQGFIETLAPNQIATILTKKKIEGNVESYYYSTNEFDDAFSIIQDKNQFLATTESTLKSEEQTKLDDALDNAKVIHKISFIAKLAENPSLENLNRIKETVSLTIFNENQAREILSIIEKNLSEYENLSTVIIQNLLKNQKPDAIKRICASNTNICRVLFKNKIENQESAASKLDITDLAELISNLPEKNEVITYLETRFLEKITNLTQNSQLIKKKISKSLLTILNAKNNANNAKIFEFIYCNRQFDFLRYIHQKHLIKSFSNQLDTKDNSLKCSLTNDLCENNDEIFKFRDLRQNNISKIFLEAEKNAYSLPVYIIEKLVNLMANNAADPNDFTNISSRASNDTEIKERCFSIIFYTHRYVYQKTEFLYADLYSKVITYLENNPIQLAELIVTQSHHSDFMNFFDDQSISTLLKSETILQIFLIAQRKNIALNQPLKNHLITRLLEEKDVIQLLSKFFTNQNTHSSSTEHTSSTSSTSNSSQPHASYTDENSKKAYHELIIEIHQKVYEKNRTQYSTLINYLTKDNLINLLRYQGKHPHLEKMFSDPTLLAKITAEVALELLITVVPIPHAMGETLCNKIFFRPGFQIETAIEATNSNPKACAAFLLTAFSFSHRNANWNNTLTAYLIKNPDKIANIFLHGVNEPGFNFDIDHLLAFIENQKILNALQKTENRHYLHLAFLNISQSLLTIENKMQLIHKFTPTLLQQDIVDIFTQAKTRTPEIHLPPEIRSLLVEALNFKRLPRLIRTIEEKQTEPEIIKGALETIYHTQIEHQIQNEKKSSIPALFLSLPYAALYYFSVIGLVLHFVLPVSRPSHLYAWLKHVFSPKQIEIEFTEKFNKKVWLGKIADKKHSIAEESIIPDQPAPTNTASNSSATLSNTTNTPPKTSLINAITGEIDPVCGTTNPSYTYLFPGTKERLDHKIHAVKTKIKALKNTGALFRPDKNSYFINGEEKELFLAEVQKKTN